MQDILLSYHNVHIAYDGISVVHEVSFEAIRGSVTCIVGESGSGKSTLVKAAMGLLGPGGMVASGEIRYMGRNLLALTQKELRGLCGNELALVFQDSLSALTPLRRIGDQIFEAMSAHRRVSRSQCRELAADMFSKLGLEDPERVLASYPFNLSGGMGQRVGIAMALLMEPKVLFADEPTSALDTISQRQVIDLFRQINEERGTTIVLVTHNMGVVRALADWVLVLRDGEMMEYGETSQVLTAPAAPYTRELLRATPRLCVPEFSIWGSPDGSRP